MPMAAPRRKSAAYWNREIEAAMKRDKDFHQEGRRVLNIYSGERKDEIPFNILFSNTETYLPALYSALPRPVVERRYRDADPVGLAAAEAGERALEFLLDTDLDGYETFDEAMQAGVLDALLPGRGVTAVKYDAEFHKQALSDAQPAPDDSQAASSGVSASDSSNSPQDAVQDASEDDEREDGPENSLEVPAEEKGAELVCCDAITWDRMVHGYAKKWSKVPWVAYRMDLDKSQAIELVGRAAADKLSYIKGQAQAAGKDEKAPKNQGEVATACVWQVWDKVRREVIYVSDKIDQIMAPTPDPLGLSGFFNCPKPITFIAKSNDLTVTTPYLLYENQATELNILTVRINRVSTALKVRGAYDGSLGDAIKQIFEADDNEFIPTDEKTASFQDGAFEKSIWIMPLRELMEVLSQLYLARDACKNVIFEIMGLADIMRGASQASETLGAQQIKQSWSSLRLRRTQKEVQRYAVDLLRMMLEVAAKKFSVETWARMTGLPYLTDEQYAAKERIFMAAQQQLGMNPQDANAQKALQESQEAMKVPKWSDVLATLRDDLQRAYRIDIETNSTVEPEAVEDQKNIADVMNALGQFLNSVSPLIAKGVMPFQAAQAMMLSITRRFRFGKEIEQYILQMKAPAQEDPNAGKAQELQAQQAQHAAELQSKEKIELEKVRASQADAAARQQQEMARIEAQRQADIARAQEQTTQAAMKLEADRKAKQSEQAHLRELERMKLESEERCEREKVAMQIAGQIEIARIGALAKTAGETPEAEVAADETKSIERILEAQERLIAMVMAPKKIVRDATTGLVDSIVPHPPVAGNGSLQ